MLKTEMVGEAGSPQNSKIRSLHEGEAQFATFDRQREFPETTSPFPASFMGAV